MTMSINCVTGWTIRAGPPLSLLSKSSAAIPRWTAATAIIALERSARDEGS
jgi:hypothetical protein